MKKAVHRVAESLQSIADRILEMRDRLVVGQSTNFFTLVEVGATDLSANPALRKGQLLITFLSLLELAKIGLVSLFQSENYADIHVETKREINSDVISAVENYESQPAAAVSQMSFEVTEDPEPAVDRATAVAQTASLTPAEEFAVDAATDEEIAAEELKYGE